MHLFVDDYPWARDVMLHGPTLRDLNIYALFSDFGKRLSTKIEENGMLGMPKSDS
jgi:hypothetical protein